MLFATCIESPCYVKHCCCNNFVFYAYFGCKTCFCLGVTIYVIGKTGSILGYKTGCFEFFITTWIIILCAFPSLWINSEIPKDLINYLFSYFWT